MKWVEARVKVSDLLNTPFGERQLEMWMRTRLKEQGIKFSNTFNVDCSDVVPPVEWYTDPETQDYVVRQLQKDT